MAYAQRQPVMTPEEFLAWEATQQEKHDFVDGEVFAMAGAERRHIVASMNIAFALRQHLSDSRCGTFMADMKVAAADESSYFYPDVVVACDERGGKDPLLVREPTLIVEVLSPSTAAYDLGAKFARYQRIASLREIVFIDLDERRASVYRKDADGRRWMLESFDQGADVLLASVDLTMTAAALFAGVDEAESGSS